MNLYTDSELDTPNAKITQKTGYPESETVELTVSAKNTLSLLLRIPSWCENAEIRIGETTDHPSAGRHRIPQLPGGETTIRIHHPMPVRLIRGTMAQTNRAALYEIQFAPRAVSPFKLKAESSMRFNLIVNLHDGKQRIGWLELAPGIGQYKNPGEFMDLLLLK